MKRSVSRCVCHRRNFDEIKEISRVEGLNSLKELKENHYCACACGMCEPYIENMLSSGQTSFHPSEIYR